MMDHTLSGADDGPSQGALPGPDAGETLPSIDSPRAASRPDPAPAGEPGERTSDPGAAVGDTPRPRRRRRGGARRRRPAQSAEAEPLDGQPATAEESSQAESSPWAEEGAEEFRAEAVGSEPGRKRRRRRRRKPVASEAGLSEPLDGAPRSGPEEADEPTAPSVTEEVDEPEAPASASKKRRRRRRREEPEGEAAAAPAPAAAAEGETEAQEDATDREKGRRIATKKRREPRRRRSRRSAASSDGPVAVEGIPGEDDELELQAPEGMQEPDEEHESPRRETQRERAVASRKSGIKNVILVNAADREETRVAVVEDGRIADFQMTARRHNSLVNDIYRGRVVNLEPAIGAAFIDFGQGRNGFLHTSDVLSAYGEEDWQLSKLLTTQIDPEEWDEKSSQPDVAAELDENGVAVPIEGADAAPSGSREGGGKGRERGRRERGRGGRPRGRARLPISDLLEKGDGVVVQVTKDAIGDKGPTLTTYISIPGRYLVLMPSMARTGVSRKIEDEKERRRLKRILESLDVPPGMGVIVRTAGTGCTKAEIKRDLDYLLLLWESFGQRLTLGRGPAPLYEESDVAIRTVRDLLTDDTEAVIIDEPKVHQRVAEFVEKLMPEDLGKVKLHEGPRPLFHTHGVEQEFERIFSRRIDLPSGGSIVFDPTEALVAIDVNSGKTRSDGFDFEDIALRTNLDAVPEIARQIRLRDLGGIIVIDFIDMLKSSHRRQVERALREAVAGDRARSKVGRISQFGLLELTRQRLGPGLSKMLFQNCPRCRGSGRLRTVESRSEAILRRLGSALTLKGFTRVEVRAVPEVVENLQTHYAALLAELEARHQRELTLVGVDDQVDDSVLRYLRADGREVRPGGRRKR